MTANGGKGLLCMSLGVLWGGNILQFVNNSPQGLFPASIT